jgi:hypothetical protein
MVAWIWGWMEGLKLELDESFGGAISSKFATSRKLLLLHQNTLVASARYLYYRMWYLKYLMLQGVVLFFFFYLPVFQVETTHVSHESHFAR